MNANIRLLVCVVAIATPFAHLAAAEPAARTGRVLLIDYDRMLEGDIERVGDRFRIRQGAGEMTVPAGPEMLLLADKDSAYQLLKRRIKVADPLAHVKLARWCLANELKTDALREAEAALALLPDDRSLQRFRDDVKVRISLIPPAPIAPAVQTSSTPLTVPEVPEVADISPESFGLFATKVQLLLVNACASCHATNRGGNFHLVRPTSAFGDKHVTQLNLAAVSPFVNRQQPAASPLLTRAVAAHGGSELPPIRDRQTPAYRYLDEWVQQACGSKPRTTPPPAALPIEAIADALPLPPQPPAKLKDSAKNAPPPVVLQTGNGDQPVPPSLIKPTDAAARAKPTESPMLPATKANPDDPFDPELFNLQNKPPAK